MWIQKKSKTKNRIYYYNDETKESVWEKPKTDHHIYHILIKHVNSKKPINDRSEEDARGICENILYELSKSEDVYSAFTDMARKFSECSSKSKGGDLGYLIKDCFYPNFEETAYRLNQGTYSDIVETPSGMHIIYRK